MGKRVARKKRIREKKRNKRGKRGKKKKGKRWKGIFMKQKKIGRVAAKRQGVGKQTARGNQGKP